jgi:hypothetical protein
MKARCVARNLIRYTIQVKANAMLMATRYPDRVTLLRGNHESRQITQVYGFYGALRTAPRVCVAANDTQISRRVPAEVRQRDRMEGVLQRL